MNKLPSKTQCLILRSIISIKVIWLPIVPRILILNCFQRMIMKNLINTNRPYPKRDNNQCRIIQKNPCRPLIKALHLFLLRLKNQLHSIQETQHKMMIYAFNLNSIWTKIPQQQLIRKRMKIRLIITI